MKNKFCAKTAALVAVCKPMARTGETVTNVPYIDIDADGNQQGKTCENAIVVTGQRYRTWGAAGSESWYVVNADTTNGEITVAGRITVNGDVNLILADGATLTASAGIQVATGNSLTIYAQSVGSGALTANGSDNAAGIGGDDNRPGDIDVSVGTVTISGCTVNAKSGGGVGFIAPASPATYASPAIFGRL